MFYNEIVEELRQLQAQQETAYVVEEKGQCEWFEFNVHLGAVTQVGGGVLWYYIVRDVQMKTNLHTQK